MKKMMRATLILMCVLLIATSAAAAAKAPSDAKIANANIDFGFALYGKLPQSNENLVYSPLSLSMALQMTAMGAKGKTLSQMQKALKINGMPMDALMAYNQKLLVKVQSSTRQAGAPVVSISNGMFIREELVLNDAFVNAAKTFYESETQRVNFADPATVGVVNGWIRQKTNGKIDKLFDAFDENAALALVNTVYFQGDWQREFNANLTSDGTFTGTKGAQTVKMMYSDSHLAYAESGKYQAAYLPYKDENIGMLVALPKGKTSVNAMIKEFNSAAKLQKLFARLVPREVMLTLPRFSAQSELGVMDALKKLGMKDAFTTSADFSGIAGTKGNLLISQVKHKAVIEVAEKGTTAAAATGVELSLTSAPIGTPAVMRVDRPFFFAVVNRATNSILFMGVINNI